MNLELNKWEKSNVNVNFVLDEASLEQYKVKSIKKIWKDFKAPGFREGHVPADIIKKQVGEEYIRANAIELAINDSLDKLLKDNQEEYKFIWDIYNLAIIPDGEDIKINYSVDIYPSISKLNDNWKKLKVDKFDDEATAEEVESSFKNLMSQYAERKDVDQISENSSAKAKIIFVDDNGVELETSRVFVNNADMQEHKIMKDNFLWKKINEEFEIKYNHDKLPHTLHYHKDEQKPSKILVTIEAIQDAEIPEMNPENIKKFFWNEWINSEEDLKLEIAKVIKSEKWNSNLTNVIEKYLNEAQASFETTIPKTMIEYEFASRIENMSKRFGSKDKMEKYLQVVNEKNENWNINDYYEEIRKSAEQSISKFFLFKKITEELWIDKDINREVELEPEKKLNEHLSK